MDRIKELEKLVLYLAEFAEEQGSDYGLWYDAEPDLFNYPLLKELKKKYK